MWCTFTLPCYIAICFNATLHYYTAIRYHYTKPLPLPKMKGSRTPLPLCQPISAFPQPPSPFASHVSICGTPPSFFCVSFINIFIATPFLKNYFLGKNILKWFIFSDMLNKILQESQNAAQRTSHSLSRCQNVFNKNKLEFFLS